VSNRGSSTWSPRPARPPASRRCPRCSRYRWPSRGRCTARPTLPRSRRWWPRRRSASGCSSPRRALTRPAKRAKPPPGAQREPAELRFSARTFTSGRSSEGVLRAPEPSPGQRESAARKSGALARGGSAPNALPRANRSAGGAGNEHGRGDQHRGVVLKRVIRDSPGPLFLATLPTQSGQLPPKRCGLRRYTACPPSPLPSNGKWPSVTQDSPRCLMDNDCRTMHARPKRY
jgi:hypothetical protein